MSKQILSIYGLYLYDRTLFDEMALPEAVDKDKLISNLILELGVMETLYPDSDFMKAAIKVWSEKECPVWEELYKTTQYVYDPISNYDRTETFSTKREGKNSDSGSGESSNNVVGKTAAFNSPVLENKDGADSNGNSSYNSERNIDETVTHTGTTKGNIGVTTTQQMIEAQRNVVAFNIYNYIIDSFKSRFCIMVY